MVAVIEVDVDTALRSKNPTSALRSVTLKIASSMLLVPAKSNENMENWTENVHRVLSWNEGRSSFHRDAWRPGKVPGAGGFRYRMRHLRILSAYLLHIMQTQWTATRKRWQKATSSLTERRLSLTEVKSQLA